MLRTAEHQSPEDRPSGMHLTALDPTARGALVIPDGPVVHRYTANGVPKIVQIGCRILNRIKPVLTIGYGSLAGVLARNLTSGVHFFFNRVR